MTIPTEPIGSIPRPDYLLAGLAANAAGNLSDAELAELTERAVKETLDEFEATGSPVVTDGEQGKPSFATYPIAGATALSPDGVVIPFADGHTRQLPALTAGPFKYTVSADGFTSATRKLTASPVKQAVIAASALSLLYPADGIDGYSREEFLDDLVSEATGEIRRCLDAGADSVQLDFTEARLSLKLDPSGGLLQDFVALNNRVLDNFTEAEQARLGVHTCPGGDQDSTHSADVDYAGLLPTLLQLHVGKVYVALAAEPDPDRVLAILAEHKRPGQRVFIGVTDPIDPRVESAEEVRDRVLRAAQHLPVDELGTCDDCGFSPFGDDTSTARAVAFAKIRARVEGTALAAAQLGL
jgi:5-methyltetrahydropteroyltriglutamate--homocysteine methyltransferase